MIKYIVTEKIISERRLDSITCDICNKQYFDDNTSEGVMEIQEFFKIRMTGGYGSVFGDESTLAIDICQHCFKEMLESKIPDLNKFIKD